MTVTDAERAKARRVTRPTFDATQPPPRNSRRRGGAPRRGGGRGAEKAEEGARALAPIKRRVLEKRILLRPHWAEDDRRKRRAYRRAKFEQVRIYALWPERDRDVKALVATYAAGDDDMEYVRFCKDAEPRPPGPRPLHPGAARGGGERGRAPRSRCCMRMALNKAAKIRRRRAEAEEAAKLALLGRARSRPARAAPVRGRRRRPDVAAGRLPEAAGARPRPTRATDGRGGFLGGRPPPVPSTRTQPVTPISTARGGSGRPGRRGAP